MKKKLIKKAKKAINQGKRDFLEFRNIFCLDDPRIKQSRKDEEVFGSPMVENGTIRYRNG